MLQLAPPPQPLPPPAYLTPTPTRRPWCCWPSWRCCWRWLWWRRWAGVVGARFGAGISGAHGRQEGRMQLPGCTSQGSASPSCWSPRGPARCREASTRCGPPRRPTAPCKVTLNLWNFRRRMTSLLWMRSQRPLARKPLQGAENWVSTRWPPLLRENSA